MSKGPFADVYVVNGLGFGDEGKGALVSHLARKAFDVGLDVTVVRYNGGAQAAHNVVFGSDNRSHTFSQLGAGTMTNGKTHLSQHFLFNATNYWRELQVLQVNGMAPKHVTIDPRAKVITAYHQAANRAREDARGAGRHGSCAQGIGEVMADSLEYPDMMLLAGFMNDPRIVKAVLEFWREKKAQDISDLGQPVPAIFGDDNLLHEYVTDVCDCPITLLRDEDLLELQNTNTDEIIFEGAQGVLLDEDYGFHPHTTWSHSTTLNADRMIGSRENWRTVTKIGVMRGYMTRHGAGPMVTEDPTLTYPEPHNGVGQYQGSFRLGHLDLVALKYALTVTDVDYLCIRHTDLLPEQVKVCVAYDNMVSIPVIAPDDFAARERLTKMLFEAKPIYEMVALHDLRWFIESILGKTMLCQGTGPHINDTMESYRAAEQFSQ